MTLWLILFSGLFLGFHDIAKKKALKENSFLSVLAVYSFFCFIFVLYSFSNAFTISFQGFLLILLKTILLFASGLLSFSSLQNLPISIIAPFGILTPIFSIFIGVFVLGENIGLLQTIGIVIILITYYFIGKASKLEVTNLFKNKYVYLMAFSALLSAISSLVDKIALQNASIEQMQFWTYLILAVLNFAVLFYFIRLDTNRQPFKINNSLIYIILTSIFLVISNWMYFYAINIPDSQISIIIPLRKVAIVISTVVGGIMLKEKNIKSKLICVIVLIMGMTMIFLGK